MSHHNADCEASCLVRKVALGPRLFRRQNKFEAGKDSRQVYVRVIDGCVCVRGLCYHGIVTALTIKTVMLCSVSEPGRPPADSITDLLPDHFGLG